MRANSTKIISILLASLMLITIFSGSSLAQCTTNCTPLNETWGSTASCVGFAQSTSNSSIVNHTFQAYSPGGAGNEPGDGEYSIRCDGDENNSGWWGGNSSAIADHTTDAAGQSGFYALINGGAGPREFYHTTVSNLCPSTTYNLTFYAGNIVKGDGAGACNYGLLPSLKAYTYPDPTASNNTCLGSKTATAGCTTAGGTLIGSTGNMICNASMIWNQFSYPFTTGAAETSIDIVLTSLNTSGAGNDFAIDDITVTWSSGGGVSCTPNPVELISFTAEKAPPNVTLEWSTATELNNDYFLIEKSIDGINFEPIGTVKGNGTRNEIINYTFEDNSYNNGIVYYRLKQVDFDSKFKYSSIKSVNVDSADPVIITNDPSSSQAELLISFYRKGEATFTIVDMLGRVVYNGSRLSDESSISINKSMLCCGIYIVKVQIGSELISKKIALN